MKQKNKDKFLFLFLFIFITLFLYYNFPTKSALEFFGRIRFLEKNDTINFVKSDKDNYIKKLTEYDIKAQKSKNKKEYQTKIIESASSLTPIEKQKLLKACKRADNALRNINLPGFDGNKAANLDWNIALTRGKKYEDGLPHTRLDTIFISDNHPLSYSDEQIAKTMLHEKVHVYERLYPEDIQIWIKHAGFKPYKKWKDYKIARSNPDIDEWSYLDKEGKPLVVLYKTKNPNSIHEVEYSNNGDPTTEHPYEVLAYLLENYL